MIKILFVCHGNICRSPMAEFILKKIVNDKNISSEFFIFSCATSNEEIGNDIYPKAKETLIKHNIPFTKRQARRLTKDDYNNFDYIIAMDNNNINNILNIVGKDNDKKIYKLLEFIDSDEDIEDPWYTRNFDSVYKEIYLGCEAFLKNVIY